MIMTKAQRRRVLGRLRELFDRSGCIRLPDAIRRELDGPLYKKGYELRFVAYNETELREIRRLLVKIGVEPTGTPYQKRKHLVQPIYGRQAVIEVCDAIGLE